MQGSAVGQFHGTCRWWRSPGVLRGQSPNGQRFVANPMPIVRGVGNAEQAPRFADGTLLLAIAPYLTGATNHLSARQIRGDHIDVATRPSPGGGEVRDLHALLGLACTEACPRFTGRATDQRPWCGVNT